MTEKVDIRELAAAIMKALLKAYHFVTLTDTEEILIYRDGIYEREGDAFIKKKIQQNMEDKGQISNHLVLEVLGHIKRETLAPRSIFVPTNPHLVFENCTLNIETMVIEPFSPDRYELNRLPVRYDPAADCPNFRKFLLEILSPEDAAGIQEELGAILRKMYLTKKLSIYLGDTDTGKTTLVNVFLKLLGEKNVSSVSIQDLASKNRFAIAELYGKLANIRDDLPKDVIYSVGKLKELTGGFQVQAERKFLNPFDFVNYAFLIFTCNVLPPVGEDDNAFYNRVVIRKFLRRFGGHERPDRELLRKLTTPEELSGILNWALGGLRRLKENGYDFTTITSTDETRLDYKRRSDPIWAFVEEKIDDSDGEAYVPKEELYNAFRKYCEVNGFQNPGKDYFYKHLGDKVTVSSGQRGPKGKQRHCFVGVKLKGGQVTTDAGSGAYHADHDDQTGVKGGDSQGKQGMQGAETMRNSSSQGICEYCGSVGSLNKTEDGYYICAKCQKETKA